MTRFITLLLLLSCFLLQAQKKDKKKDSIPDGWRSLGQAELLFSQSAFSNDWQGGGTNNVAGSFNINWDLNYKKRRLSWITKLTGILGLASARDQKFVRKTSDRFEINSLVGSQIPKSPWYYSGIFNFRTQLLAGFEFFERDVINDVGMVVNQVEDRRLITDAFSPAYIQIGPGFLWKKSSDFTMNLAPATARFILVSRRFTAVDPDDTVALAAYEPFFGVAANETLRFELGASVSLYYKEEIFENIVVENILNLYTNYLENAQNIDLDYTLNIALEVNKFVTTNLALQFIYDDDAVRGLQVRQVLGIGLKYAFLEWKS